MKRFLNIALVACMAAMIASCSGNKFKVDGQVEGAEGGESIMLELSNSGMWLPVDSTKVAKDGKFAFAEEAPAYPGIYRVRLGNESIYFPIDSLDVIEVNTKKNAFSSEYTLSGSDNAVAVMEIDRKAREFAMTPNAEAMNEWKLELAKQILAEPSSMVAYYAISKFVGNQPLFSAANDIDYKIIGAVVNGFNSFRPTDPRTATLVRDFRRLQTERRQALSTAANDTVYAEEVKLFDITLNDEKGKSRSLNEVASHGKVVVLNFTLYDMEQAPVFNKILSDIYKKYQSRGLEIFQVAFDADEYQWEQSAKNLPWITVHDAEGGNSRYLSVYNVMGVPTSFIIDRNGEVVDRIEDSALLESRLARHF